MLYSCYLEIYIKECMSKMLNGPRSDKNLDDTKCNLNSRKNDQIYTHNKPLPLLWVIRDKTFLHNLYRQ